MDLAEDQVFVVARIGDDGDPAAITRQIVAGRRCAANQEPAGCVVEAPAGFVAGSAAVDRIEVKERIATVADGRQVMRLAEGRYRVHERHVMVDELTEKSKPG